MIDRLKKRGVSARFVVAIYQSNKRKYTTREHHNIVKLAGVGTAATLLCEQDHDVLNCLSKPVQTDAMQTLHTIWLAASKAGADKVFERNVT